jgi:universal stress protein A
MQEPIKKIILATDFLESSKDIGNRALFLAHAYKAELMVIHVLDIDEWYFPRHNFYTEEGFDKLSEGQAQVRQKRKNALKELTDTFDLNAEPIFTEGDPGHEIIRVAEERNADLIVLGTHGHTGWNRFTIGAVVAFVIKHAHCAVFAVRPIKK